MLFYLSINKTSDGRGRRPNDKPERSWCIGYLVMRRAWPARKEEGVKSPEYNLLKKGGGNGVGSSGIGNGLGCEGLGKFSRV